MSGTVMMTAHGLSVRRGGRPVVEDVSLELRAGELLALVGPNGAGKSTLLHALAGDVGCASGEVRVEGRPLGRWRPVDLARRRAVLPQRTVLAFAFTARQVVAMGRHPWADRPADDEAAVGDALQCAGVEALAERRFPSLSGGEAALVCLARALAQDTPVLLADEPTASLDISHAEHTMAVLRALADAGRAVLCVVHDLNLAAAYAHRVAVLAAGRLAAVGPPGHVLTAALLTMVYGHPLEVVPHPNRPCPLVLAGGGSR